MNSGPTRRDSRTEQRAADLSPVWRARWGTEARSLTDVGKRAFECRSRPRGDLTLSALGS